jgi:hypothetical protein
MTPVTSTNEQEVPVTYEIQTEGGQPAEVEGGLQVEVLEGDATAVVEDKVVTVISGTTIGRSRIRVYGDADLGPGINHIEDIIEYDVTGAQAARFAGTVGSPRPKRTA